MTDYELTSNIFFLITIYSFCSRVRLSDIFMFLLKCQCQDRKVRGYVSFLRFFYYIWNCPCVKTVYYNAAKTNEIAEI